MDDHVKKVLDPICGMTIDPASAPVAAMTAPSSSTCAAMPTRAACCCMQRGPGAGR
jgi:hypothetical protein